MTKEKLIIYLERVSAIALYILVFSIPFSKAIIEICATIAISAWIVKKIISPERQKIPVTFLNWPIAAFLLFNIISVMFSMYPSLSYRAIFSKVCEHLVLFFVVVDTLREKTQIKKVILFISISACIVAIDGIVQQVRGTDLIRLYPLHEMANVRACFKNPNDLAGWIILCIPICVAAIMHTQYGYASRYMKMFFGVVAVLLFIGLFMTDSRAAWIAFVCGSIFFLYWIVRPLPYKRKIIVYTLFFLALIVFMVVLPSSIKERMMSITDTHVNINRISLWKKALIIIDNHPFVGTGLNTYTQVSPQYYLPRARNEYPHNSYLHMAAEIGIGGVCAFLWIMGILFWCGIVWMRRRGDPLLIGLLSGITSFLIHSFFDTNLFTLQLIIFFWFLVGITVRVIQLHTKDASM